MDGNQTTPTRIEVPPLCDTHRVLLVRQTGMGPLDPWRAMEISVNIALFQAATVDKRVWEELGGDATQLPKLGCLACRKPDAFGELVQAAQQGGIGAVRNLGLQWVGKASGTELEAPISIEEAAQRGIPRLCNREWPPEDYIKIDIVDGKPGPFVHLFAVGTERRDLLCTDKANYLKGEWTPYTGILHNDDKE